MTDQDSTAAMVMIAVVGLVVAFLGWLTFLSIRGEGLSAEELSKAREKVGG